MTPRAKVRRNGAIRGEEPLRMARRFKPLHPPFPLARGLVGVFGPIIQIAVLAVFDTGEKLPLRGTVALELVRDDYPWDILTPFEELPKELLGRCFVAAALHQDIEHIPVLIHRPPEIVPFAVDREEDFVQMPFVTRAGAPPPQLISIRLAKLAAPLADGFVRHRDTAGKQQLFDIAITEAKTAIEPNGVADDLDREAVVLIGVRKG